MYLSIFSKTQLKSILFLLKVNCDKIPNLLQHDTDSPNILVSDSASKIHTHIWQMSCHDICMYIL